MPTDKHEFVRIGMGILAKIANKMDTTTIEGWVDNKELYEQTLTDALVPPPGFRSNDLARYLFVNCK